MHTVTDFIASLPATVTTVTADTWQDDNGMVNIIVWAASKGSYVVEEYQDSEYDFDFRPCVEDALLAAGFTFPGEHYGEEWFFFGLSGGAELTLTATR